MFWLEKKSVAHFKTHETKITLKLDGAELMKKIVQNSMKKLQDVARYPIRLLVP